MRPEHRIPPWLRSAAIGFTVILLAAGLACGALFWQLQGTVTQATQSETRDLAASVGRAVGRQFQRAARLDIPLDEIPTIDRSLSNTLEHVPGLARIKLQDAAGHTLGSASRSPGTETSDAVRTEILVDGRVVATLDIEPSDAAPAGSLKQFAAETLLLILSVSVVGGLCSGFYGWHIQRHQGRLQALLDADPDAVAPDAAGADPGPHDPLARAWHTARQMVNETARRRSDLEHQAQSLLAVDFDGRLRPHIAALSALRSRSMVRLSITPPPSILQMSLRLRLTLIVALGFATLIGTLTGFQMIRERILQQQTADIAITDQTALWHQFMSAETLSAMGTLQDITTAAGGSGAADLMALAAARPLNLDRLELIDPNRQVYPILGGEAAGTMLDAGSLDQVFAGAPATGLRNLSDHLSMLIAARPVTLQGETWVLIGGRNLEGALRRYARSDDGSMHFLNVGGTLIASTAPESWLHAGLQLPTRQATHKDLTLGKRIFTATSTPVGSVAGGVSGTLVSLKDVTRLMRPNVRLGRLALLLAGMLALAGIMLIYRMIWRSFRPLQTAIQTLESLSTHPARPDAPSVPVHGADEIDSLTQGIAAFRHNTEQMTRDRNQRERVRRRQEAVIARELHVLASAMDATNREELLELIDKHTDAGGEDDALRRLAEVMSEMRRRLVEQHQRLTAMVVELRDSLVTKTKLAGLQQELQIASAVQISILPRTMPADSRMSLNSHIIPAREVGGDFYDYYMLDEHHIGFVIADVSGKGVPAALFMAISRTLLKATAMFVTSPSACIRRLNDLLSIENEQMLFVTMFYAILDLRSGQLDYVNAGHHAPWLMRGDGRLEALPATHGMAVGVMEGIEYPQESAQLRPGDTLYLYTDGITEAFNPEKQVYGEDRLASILRGQAPGASLEDISQTVIQDVRAFERGTLQTDDITSLCLRFHGLEGR